MERKKGLRSCRLRPCRCHRCCRRASRGIYRGRDVRKGMQDSGEPITVSTATRVHQCSHSVIDAGIAVLFIGHIISAKCLSNLYFTRVNSIHCQARIDGSRGEGFVGAPLPPGGRRIDGEEMEAEAGSAVTVGNKDDGTDSLRAGRTSEDDGGVKAVLTTTADGGVALRLPLLTSSNDRTSAGGAICGRGSG